MWFTSYTKTPVGTLLILISYWAIGLQPLAAEVNRFDGTPRQIAQLRPGMTIQVPEPPRVLDRATDVDRRPLVVTRPLLIARPRLAAGDLQGLSSTIFEFAGLTHPAIVASVVEPRNPAHTERYQLHQVGIGLTVPQDERQLVVTSETANQLGIEFDFVQRQVVAHAERQLGEVMQVARDSENLLFDIPAVLLRDQRHQAMTIRHLVQLDPHQGEVSTILWLLRRDPSGQNRLAERTMEHLPAGFREDRRIHVQRDKFFLGVPTPEAFAMVDIPRGRGLPIPRDVEELAAVSTFTEREFARLTDAIRQAISDPNEKRRPSERLPSPRRSQ